MKVQFGDFLNSGICQFLKIFIDQQFHPKSPYQFIKKVILKPNSYTYTHIYIYICQQVGIKNVMKPALKT